MTDRVWKKKRMQSIEKKKKRDAGREGRREAPPCTGLSISRTGKAESSPMPAFYLQSINQGQWLRVKRVGKDRRLAEKASHNRCWVWR